MLKLDKKQSAKYFLLELLSEQTRLRESAAVLKRMACMEPSWNKSGQPLVDKECVPIYEQV